MVPQRSNTMNINSSESSEVKEPASEEDEITYRENDTDLSESQLLEEELEIFGLNEGKKDDEEPETALITINEDEFGLTIGQKYDVLEDNTWIGDTGDSTHMTNSDEGMYGCMPANNQYIKAGSGGRLQIMKKGCKQCTIWQKDGRKTQVVLYNVYYIPKL